MSVFAYSPWVAPILAAAIAAAMLGILSWGAARSRLRLPLDYPSGRSLHDRPVSRVGGIAIWAGFLPAALFSAGPLAGNILWLAPWAFVIAVSFADDWFGVRPSVRLAVQALAALAFALALPWDRGAEGFPTQHVLVVIATAFAIVWSANLFNFMDGNDGLAAVMSICGFGAFGVAAARAGANADVFFALSAAALVFLFVNLPPARAFMGDGGSVGLGFLAAAFGFSGIRSEIWPSWFPLLVFLPFAADATVTVLRRLARGDHLFEAHRTHYYQRLHQMGSGHRGTLLFYAILIFGTSASALVALAIAPGYGWSVTAAWIVAIGVVFAGIDYHWRRRTSEQQ
jgi:UDP-N-acetylmuramyl pentapeptide phosphotransferase/UDP-N-acetylglucosamine-1-phosphate transferase